MKKTLLFSAIALSALAASAQVIESPGYFDNWTIGIQGGVTTPLRNHAFFGSMRPIVGLNIDKQVTPALAIGAEGIFAINTSSWTGRQHSATAFDDSYLGMYAAVDFGNLFGGYNGTVRPFSVEGVLGAGWGHSYFTKQERNDHNYFATKLGLNFNFNVSEYVTINVSPSLYYDMSDAGVANTSAAYNANKATFNIMAGVNYHFGGNSFDVVMPYNQAMIDVLNGQINDMRAQLTDAEATNVALEANNAALSTALAECMNAPATVEVVKEVETNNYLNSVRFVFFKIGSSTITADQQPNVEMIADYMKSHPDAKVVIKGYASKDGNLDFNIKLAQKRAESVRNMLINRYKINANRITAEGEGVGNMFDEESWNRVSICTIESED